jgi:phosphoribosylanthranilate isomerase
LIKAFQLKDQQQLGRLKEYSVCDHFLIDTYAKDQRGGTGKVADWSLARLAKDFGPVILAGGLNPGNIKEAFQTVEPFAVDVSSGVEERPGIKSTEKLHKLFEACAGHD